MEHLFRLFQTQPLMVKVLLLYFYYVSFKNHYPIKMD